MPRNPCRSSARALCTRQSSKLYLWRHFRTVIAGSMIRSFCLRSSYVTFSPYHHCLRCFASALRYRRSIFSWEDQGHSVCVEQPLISRELGCMKLVVRGEQHFSATYPRAADTKECAIRPMRALVLPQLESARLVDDSAG